MSVITKGKIWFAAIAIFLCSATLLIFLTIWIDDTNYGTQNGLWKSVYIKQFLSPEFTYDNPPDLSFWSNLYYIPFYAFIIKFWPSGFETTIIQKMSIINSIFGAISLVFIFLIMIKLTASYLASMAATGFHCSCAIFLTVTTGSEDIIPAYCFFVASTYYFLKYLKYTKNRFLVIASFLFAISWFFHWTVIIAAPAFALAIIFFSGRRAFYGILLFMGINIVLIFLNGIIFSTSFLKIIFPGKGLNSGYLGFSLQKFILLYSGMVQYVIGGFQFNGIEVLREAIIVGDWFRAQFIFGSFVLIFLLLFAVYFLIKNRDDLFILKSAFFFIVVFLSAQLMNAYEFGTDLQFHLQPMIWLSVAFGLLFHTIERINTYELGRKFFSKKIILVLLMFFPLGLLAYNVINFRLPKKNSDSFYLNSITKLQPYFSDLTNTVIVTRGWSEFENWSYANWGDVFRNNCIRITDLLEFYPEQSSQEAIAYFKRILDENISAGKLVVTDPEIIDRDPEVIANIFSGFNQRDKVFALLNTVKNEYARIPYVNTEMGMIYRLQLKEKILVE